MKIVLLPDNHVGEILGVFGDGALSVKNERVGQIRSTDVDHVAACVDFVDFNFERREAVFFKTERGEVDSGELFAIGPKSTFIVYTRNLQLKQVTASDLYHGSNKRASFPLNVRVASRNNGLVYIVGFSEFTGRFIIKDRDNYYFEISPSDLALDKHEGAGN